MPNVIEKVIELRLYETTFLRTRERVVFLLAKDVLDEFRLECQLRRLSDRTIKSYYNNTQLFLTYLGRQQQITEIEDIRTQTIKLYIQYLIKKKLAPSYINSIIRCIRAYFRFALEEQYISVNPALKVSWQKQGKSLSGNTTSKHRGFGAS